MYHDNTILFHSTRDDEFLETDGVKYSSCKFTSFFVQSAVKTLDPVVTDSFDASGSLVFKTFLLRPFPPNT